MLALAAVVRWLVLAAAMDTLSGRRFSVQLSATRLAERGLAADLLIKPTCRIKLTLALT